MNRKLGETPEEQLKLEKARFKKRQEKPIDFEEQIKLVNMGLQHTL